MGASLLTSGQYYYIHISLEKYLRSSFESGEYLCDSEGEGTAAAGSHSASYIMEDISSDLSPI
jgi:hypothetical protein